MASLIGRVAVITGGGGILPSAIAEGLARDGVRCVLLDVAEEKVQAALRRVRWAGSDGLALKTNVLSREDLEKAAQEAVKIYGRVDFLNQRCGGTTHGPPPPRKPCSSIFRRMRYGLFLILTFLGPSWPARCSGGSWPSKGKG